MKFSVVIPVYNVEQYLEECIESVLNQTYQNYEIVLVDDGSTDRSGEICDRYAVEYPDKVKVIHNENQGQLMTRSCGIQNATGDVLFIVDSDDYIRADALELLKIVFSEMPCDMVLFNASNDADFKRAYFDFPFKDGQQFIGKTKKILYEVMITTSKLNPLWIKAVSREVAQSVPTNYKNFGLKNAGDFLYAIPMLSNAKDIVYLNQNLYYYRLRPGSIIHTYNPERHKSIKKVHMEMEKYIDEWGMGEFHAKHYAREVRGWTECLRQLLMNAGNGADQILHELAEDDYFRNAYARMDRTGLSRTEAVLSKWLYQKKYVRIKLTGAVLRTARTMKHRIKR